MTTLRVPRYTRGNGPEARTLAAAIAHHLNLPASWEVDLHRSELVIDLFDTDPEDAREAARTYLDAHTDIEWSVT
jgi:hypothetical protein